MSKKLSYSLTIALVIVSSALTYFINEYLRCRITETTNQTLAIISENNPPIVSELNTYRFIKPIIIADPKNETPSFNGLKTKLTQYIESLKNAHKLMSASVYLRYYGHGAWMSINPNETYSPGSMFKVVNLLLYLKWSEQNPGLLDKKMVYNTPSYPIPAQTYGSRQIVAGEEYTIKELLKYMIVYSDNKATTWLVANMGSDLYLKMINELNIPMQQSKDGLPTMTATQYSKIIKLLYNSTYLTNENSEFALGLLNQSDFSMGLVKDLPGNVTVVHKFGEAGTKNQPEFHESGLIYMNYAPYLLTVMTKGYKVNDLPPVISTISKMVYDDISNMEE